MVQRHHIQNDADSNNGVENMNEDMEEDRIRDKGGRH